MRRALAAAAFLALALPATAGAHATLERAEPGVQSRVDTAPTVVELRFDQSVVAPPDAIVVYAADGRKVSGVVSQGDGGLVIRAPVGGLRVGEAYTVRWRVVSADGHGEREEDGGDDGTPSHGLPPASSERCPKIDATSRSENSITATAIQVIANP